MMIDAVVPNDATDPVEVTDSRVLLKEKIYLILHKKFGSVFCDHRARTDAIFEEDLHFEDLNECLVKQVLDKYSFPSSDNDVENLIYTMFVLIELAHPPRGSPDRIAHPSRLTAFKHITRASLAIFPRRPVSFYLKIGGILEDPEKILEFSAPKSKLSAKQLEQCDYNQRKLLVEAMSPVSGIRFSSLTDMMTYHTQRPTIRTPLSHASLSLVNLLLPASNSAMKPPEVLNVDPSTFRKSLVEQLRESSKRLLQCRLDSVVAKIAERFNFVVEAVKCRFLHQWYFDILVRPTLALLILPVIEKCFTNDYEKPKQPCESKAFALDLRALFQGCGSNRAEDMKQVKEHYTESIVNALQFGFFFTIFCHHVDHHSPGVADDKDGGKLYVLYPTASDFAAAFPESSNLYAFQSMLSIFMGYRSKERAIKGQCIEMCMRLDDRVFPRGGGKSVDRILREAFFHAITGIEDKRERDESEVRSPTPTPMEALLFYPSPSKRACQQNTKAQPSMKSPRTLKRCSPNPFPSFESIGTVPAKENPVDGFSQLTLSTPKRPPLLQLPNRPPVSSNVPVTPRNSEQKRSTKVPSSSSSTSAFSAVKMSASKAKATAPKVRQGTAGMESTFSSAPTSTGQINPQQGTTMAVDQAPREYVTKRVGFLPSESLNPPVLGAAPVHDNSAAVMDIDEEMSALPDDCWEGSLFPLRALESESQLFDGDADGVVGHNEGTVIPFPISTPVDEYPLSN